MWNAILTVTSYGHFTVGELGHSIRFYVVKRREGLHPGGLGVFSPTKHNMCVVLVTNCLLCSRASLSLLLVAFYNVIGNDRTMSYQKWPKCNPTIVQLCPLTPQSLNECCRGNDVIKASL